LIADFEDLVDSASPEEPVKCTVMVDRPAVWSRRVLGEFADRRRLLG